MYNYQYSSKYLGAYGVILRKNLIVCSKLLLLCLICALKFNKNKSNNNLKIRTSNNKFHVK